jgi:hypothetical protein
VGVKLEGDEDGIAQLKALHAEDQSYLKFLINEAKTNTDLAAEFRGKNGTLYVLELDPKTQNLVVSVAKNQRPSRIPGG